MRSDSKHSRAQCFSGFDEVLVQGGERQFPALSEFQVGGVVDGKPVTFCKSNSGSPCLISCLSVQRDGQGAQKTYEAVPPVSVNTPPALGHQKTVQRLQRPQDGARAPV